MSNRSFSVLRRSGLATLLVVLAQLIVLGGPGGSKATGRIHPAVAPVSGDPKVAVLMLENRSRRQIVGNRRAPFLNALIRRGGVATHYYALTHPSLPNYIGLTTGGTRGVKNDCSACRTSARSLAAEFEAANVTWRAYFEGIRNRLSTRVQSGLPYNPHYNPFAYTRGLRAPDPVADVSDFAALHCDITQRSLPRFSWIAPDIWHDGHNTRLAAVDRFVKRLVPALVSGLGPQGLLFVTWDEGRRSDHRGMNGRGGGHVPLIVLGRGARPGARVSTPADHYVLLRTLESIFHLPALGHARARNPETLAGLFRSQVEGGPQAGR